VPRPLRRSGVPVVSALSVVREMIGKQVLATAVDRLGEGVKHGAGLAAPTAAAAVFPSLALHVVRIGEETGRLEEMLRSANSSSGSWSRSSR
jgi:general secretion pathway protein F